MSRDTFEHRLSAVARHDQPGRDDHVERQLAQRLEVMKECLLNEERLLQAVRLGVLLERVFGAVGDEGRNLGLSARHVEKCRPWRWSLSSEVLSLRENQDLPSLSSDH